MPKLPYSTRYAHTNPPPPFRTATLQSPRSGSASSTLLAALSAPATKLRRSSSTLWLMGGGMFCLVLVYFAIVIVITQSHLPSPDAQSKASGHLSPMAVLEQHSEQLVVQQQHQQQQQQQQNNKNVTSSFNSNTTTNNDNRPKAGMSKRKRERERKESPFRMYNLSDTLNHGVRPDVLTERNADAVKAAMAHRIDPPIANHPTPKTVLTAYLEPPNFEEWEIKPLPLRSRAKEKNLKPVQYTRVNSCRQLIQQWPSDDTPAEEDPFLPWIHDVFPTADGKYIQFVAQNRRRCRTGVSETDILMKMQPQVALFQHISVKRIDNKKESTNKKGEEPRYRLSTHQDADPDGLATRFICRFKPSMEVTLSEFNFDYDWISYRKQYKSTFVKDSGNIKSIHTSQLVFKCPVPEHLQESIRTGDAVQNDWATLFVDLIPIRTPPRYGSPDQYFLPRYQEFQSNEADIKFDPVLAYGDQHVLPKIQDSGRWENIPVCLPSLMQYENQTKADLPAVPQERQEKHRLVSCIWASAGYTTRGNRYAVNDGQRRMLEWISYNKVIGFDHFYIYDNSGAFDNNVTSLKPITDLFPGSVTYIPWPSQVCNNRPNNVDSPGERSSQYAAETSCRLRFGPHVRWIGQFDIDEYLVPMGNHENVTSLLDELEAQDTRIISFGSWRAWPRRAFIDEIVEINDSGVCWHNEACFRLTIPANVTLLQAYNCDRQPPGKKTEVMPAEKQLYRADYVTSHFIHYSAVTKLSEKNRTEWMAEGIKWRGRAFPDKRQRFGNEQTEALMLHAKAVALQDTAGYKRMCSIENLKLPIRRQGLCRLGMPWPKPWPLDPKNATELGTKEGHAYNCYVNDQIENLLVPRLKQEIKQHLFIYG